MLWYKSWLETRWRFLIGLALLMLSAAGTVFAYPQVMALLPAAGTLETGGELGRRIREVVDLSREYRGYVWTQSFRQNLPQMATLFAALLGSGSPFSHGSGGAVLFTLSLPVSRNRLLSVRAAAGLAELLAIALAPALIIPVLSPAVGQTYSVGSGLAHAMCIFIAGAAFFSLAFFLSTVFSDLWRPLLITCAVALVLAIFEQVAPDQSRYGIYRLMSGETYFRTGELPWQGLLFVSAASMAMLYAAAINISRRDF